MERMKCQGANGNARLLPRELSLNRLCFLLLDRPPTNHIRISLRRDLLEWQSLHKRKGQVRVQQESRQLQSLCNCRRRALSSAVSVLATSRFPGLSGRPVRASVCVKTGLPDTPQALGPLPKSAWIIRARTLSTCARACARARMVLPATSCAADSDS